MILCGFSILGQALEWLKLGVSNGLPCAGRQRAKLRVAGGMS